MSQTAAEAGRYEMTEQGLRVSGSISYEVWEHIGSQLSSLHKGISWLIGDWLLFGESQTEWGEKYAQAIDGTQLDVQTLANYKWVSKTIDQARRRPTLSWSHHLLVCGLTPEQQEIMLTRAAAGKWSCSQMRRAAGVIKEGGKEAGLKFDPTKDDKEEELRFRNPPTPLESAQAAFAALTIKEKTKFRDWLSAQS